VVHGLAKERILPNEKGSFAGKVAFVTGARKHDEPAAEGRFQWRPALLRADGRARHWCGWLHADGDHSAVDPIPNHIIRSRFTPPERAPFEPAPLRVVFEPLNSRSSYIRTKTAVVRLRQRKPAKRDEKRPEVELSRRPGGSDNLPGMAAFCGVPTAN
jgi:hypothetical protein